MSNNSHAPLEAETLADALGVRLDEHVDQLKNSLATVYAVRIHNAEALHKRLIAEGVIRPNDAPNDQG